MLIVEMMSKSLGTVKKLLSNSTLCRQNMFPGLLLSKRMMIKMAMKTLLLQLLKTKVMGLETFLLRKYRQDQGNHRILVAYD